MNNTRRLLPAFVVLLLVGGALLFPALSVKADASPPPDDGTVVWNEDYKLEEGEEVGGDLVVFNGDVTLEADSWVQGSTVIWNGDANVHGQIQADLVVMSGNISLDETAHIYGDVVCGLNCDLERKSGARVEGDIIEGLPFRGFRFENGPPEPTPSPVPFYVSGVRRAFEWMLRLIRGVFTALVISVMGGLVALIWPRELDRVGETVFSDPLPSAGIGLLTAIAALALVVTLAITICLSPVALLLALAVGVAGLFGWVAVGAEVGRRLLRSLRSSSTDLEPMWAAGLGTLLITVLSLGLSAALCLAPLGWLLTTALILLGLGAVALTRFGTRPYTPGQLHRSPARPPEPTPPPPPTETHAAGPAESIEPFEEPLESEADEDEPA